MQRTRLVKRPVKQKNLPLLQRVVEQPDLDARVTSAHGTQLLHEPRCGRHPSLFCSRKTALHTRHECLSGGRSLVVLLLIGDYILLPVALHAGRPDDHRR